MPQRRQKKKANKQQEKVSSAKAARVPLKKTKKKSQNTEDAWSVQSDKKAEPKFNNALYEEKIQSQKQGKSNPQVGKANNQKSNPHVGSPPNNQKNKPNVLRDKFDPIPTFEEIEVKLIQSKPQRKKLHYNDSQFREWIVAYFHNSSGKNFQVMKNLAGHVKLLCLLKGEKEETRRNTYFTSIKKVEPGESLEVLQVMKSAFMEAGLNEQLQRCKEEKESVEEECFLLKFAARSQEGDVYEVLQRLQGYFLLILPVTEKKPQLISSNKSIVGKNELVELKSQVMLMGKGFQELKSQVMLMSKDMEVLQKGLKQVQGYSRQLFEQMQYHQDQLDKLEF